LKGCFPVAEGNSAVLSEANDSSGAKKKSDCGVDRPQKIPNLENRHADGESHPKGIAEKEATGEPPKDERSHADEDAGDGCPRQKNYKRRSDEHLSLISVTKVIERIRECFGCNQVILILEDGCLADYMKVLRGE
jgi:hypothetical protein